MDLTLIFITLFLGITGIAMGSIGVSCYNKHGSIAKNFENESNYRYLVFMLVPAVLMSVFGLYKGFTHETVKNLLNTYK